MDSKDKEMGSMVSEPVDQENKEEIFEKDEFDNNDEYDDYEDNESIDSGEVNIDEYLSNDETPDYKLKANIYILIVYRWRIF